MIETRILARAVLTLATVASLAAPALAADMKGEYGARTVGSYPAVPVPAPIPLPDTFQWYLRGDVGYSLKSTGNLSVEGTPRLNLSGPSDHDGPFVGSLAFGRYVTPSLRAEFGIDVRNQQTISRPSSYSFTTRTPSGPPDAVTGLPTNDTNTYAADRQETGTLASHTLMVNAYYDLKTGGAFTPYVGAGLGLNIAQMKRSFSESASCTSSLNDADPTLYIDPLTGVRTCGPGAINHTPVGGAKGFTSYGPALALMAGTAVQLRPGVSLDAGYRLMWQGATPSIAMGSVMGDISKLTIGARTDHELRMGLRWDIW
jgi:opacity protein-like surface antigen